MNGEIRPFHINAIEIQDCTDYSELIDALDEMHRGETVEVADLLLSEQPTDGNINHFLVRIGWHHGQALGVKMASIFSANRDHNLPAINASYVLFDGTNGIPLTSIDGNELTWRKTAADSALGSSRLARPDSKKLLMVGAGAMAPHLIRAHMSIRPSIQRIELWNRSSERRDQLIRSLRSEFDIVATDDLEQSVSTADIISCATMTKEPIVLGEWLSPGCHLDLVGAFMIDMRETDDIAMRRGRIFVDSRETTIGQIGELEIPLSTGVICEDDILADHYQLSQGAHPGRTKQNEITIFKNGGGGHLDLMTARYIYQKCRV